MTVEEFSTKYGISTPAIHVAVNQGLVPKSVLYIPDDDNINHVREDWFLRRKEFNRRVVTYIQDMYFLVSKIKTDTDIAKAIGVSLPFICHNLWIIDDRSILATRLSPARWKAFRWFRRLEIAIARRWGIKFNIADVLDAEASGFALSYEEFKNKSIRTRVKGKVYWQREEKALSLVEMVSMTTEHQHKMSA